MDEQDVLNSMQLCLIVCVSALLRHNRAVLATTGFLREVTFINMQHQQESNAAYYLYIFLLYLYICIFIYILYIYIYLYYYY